MSCAWAGAAPTPMAASEAAAASNILVMSLFPFLMAARRISEAEAETPLS
jgi:hypothetical protein